jgi:hypothetical protein
VAGFLTERNSHSDVHLSITLARLVLSLRPLIRLRYQGCIKRGRCVLFPRRGLYLNSYAIRKGLPQKNRVQLDALRRLADHSRNYHDYRTRLRNTAPPAVPFMGIFDPSSCLCTLTLSGKRSLLDGCHFLPGRQSFAPSIPRHTGENVTQFQQVS